MKQGIEQRCDDTGDECRVQLGNYAVGAIVTKVPGILEAELILIETSAGQYIFENLDSCA